MENYFAIFPRYGKIFSTLWKNRPIFPRNGKSFSDFSTQWKKFSGFFHTMEKMVLRTFPGDFLLHEMGLGPSKAFENRFECGKTLQIRGVPNSNRPFLGAAALESILPEGIVLDPCVSCNGKSPGKVGSAEKCFHSVENLVLGLFSGVLGCFSRGC